MEVNTLRTGPFNIVFVGNYLPRRCGIATFTTDLLTAVENEARDMEIWSIAMNDVPEGYRYPEEVRFELDDKNLAQYQLAAEFLNMNQVDAVSLQHEYGIFGGNYGSHILEFIGNLRMPVVTTLHTVLREPTQGQKAILEEIPHLIIYDKESGYIPDNDVVVFFGEHSKEIEDNNWKDKVINWQAPQENQLCSRTQMSMGELFDALKNEFIIAVQCTVT